MFVPPPFVPEAPGIIERPRPDWGEVAALATGVCPSGWVDFGMRKEIEAEFKNRKDYEHVDSPTEAEFVLLVEAWGLRCCTSFRLLNLVSARKRCKML